MYGKIRISGNILVKTGMHIGGSGAFAAIGAVDSPIIRDARQIADDSRKLSEGENEKSSGKRI